MQDEEQSNLRERVGHWLDCYEIIQESAQRRGMAAQEAKELARTWVPALTLRSSGAAEQRAKLAEKGLVSADELIKAVAEKQAKQAPAKTEPLPERYAYRWHIVPAAPSDSSGTLTFSTTTGEQTNCVTAKRE